jgi:signal transduction histidine kinase
LKASRRKLEDYTKNLEKKVKLRTKEVDKKIKESEEARIATLNILDDVEKTRKELEKTYKELKTMDRMKAEFMNVAAHELKTPLIPIVGYIDLLLKGDLGKINDKQMESLKTIQRNTTRLQRLIQDILDITKLESKVMKFDMKNIQIGDLVKDVANGMKISAEEKNIKMLVNIQTPLPLIYGDAQRLVQVLGDLIGNAIKFTDTGSITVEAKREKNFIKVSVTDTGIGIDKDFMPKLFQKFQQADTSAKRKFGGTGLGLAICKEIIEYHKGRIWTETKPGKGSTFIFVLPIKRR